MTYMKYDAYVSPELENDIRQTLTKFPDMLENGKKAMRNQRLHLQTPLPEYLTVRN